MSTPFNVGTIRTARHDHVCDLCGKTIEKDSKYYRCVFRKNSRKLVTEKLHESCAEIRQQYVEESEDTSYRYTDMYSWWRETRCPKCDNYFPVCEQEEICIDDDATSECPCYCHGHCTQKKACDLMTNIVWCENFTPRNMADIKVKLLIE